MVEDPPVQGGVGDLQGGALGEVLRPGVAGVGPALVLAHVGGGPVAVEEQLHGVHLRLPLITDGNVLIGHYERIAPVLTELYVLSHRQIRRQS